MTPCWSEHILRKNGAPSPGASWERSRARRPRAARVTVHGDALAEGRSIRSSARSGLPSTQKSHDANRPPGENDAAYRKRAADAEKAQQAGFVSAIHKVNDWLPLLDTSIPRREAKAHLAEVDHRTHGRVQVPVSVQA